MTLSGDCNLIQITGKYGWKGGHLFQFPVQGRIMPAKGLSNWLFKPSKDDNAKKPNDYFQWFNLQKTQWFLFQHSAL